MDAIIIDHLFEKKIFIMIEEKQSSRVKKGRFNVRKKMDAAVNLQKRPRADSDSVSVEGMR